MKIVTVKQNSKEWREWRGKGLGASDAPSVMGESPWTTPFELWLQKTGLMERPPANEFQVAAMKRGTELEPECRKLFEEDMGEVFPPISAEHDDYQYIRASYDGLSASGIPAEFKCPGKEAHGKALKGKVPAYYLPQVYLQIAIAKAPYAWYASWDGLKDHSGKVINRPVRVKVEANSEYQTRLINAIIDFWARVQNQILPDVTSKDVEKLVTEQQKALAKANSIAKVLAMITKP